MLVINVQTKGSALLIEKPLPRITSGGHNYVTLQVTFDETWSCTNGKHFALFRVDNSNKLYNRELNRDKGGSFSCLVPDEVTAKEGIFHFGVWCEADDKRIPSDIKTFRVYQGAVTSDDTDENETVSLDAFIEPMFGFFEEYYVDFNETPVVPDKPLFPIDPDIPVEQNEGGDENVTE